MEAEPKNDALGGTANMWPKQEQKERQRTRNTGQTTTMTLETWQLHLLKNDDLKFTIYKDKCLISCWRHLAPVND